MKNIIEENEKITVNTKEIEILKKHFPNCFNKDGEFQMDKFEKRISQEVDVTKEGYELRWLGKNYARLLANVETETMIVDDKEHNDKVENKNSENIYIEGDNIDVLKHLKNAYSEKIKMIYIDPPYNTGSDGFVYKDDRKYTKEDLAELTNITEKEAQRILSFNTKGSNSHSAWLTFMYPRLLTARELLSDDGVIFISIDDNEVSQLKLLCDEVFGEENFVAELPTIMNLKGNNDEFGFAGTHEYTLVYSKNKNMTQINHFYIDETELEEWEEDETGFYKQGRGILASSAEKFREDRPYLYFPILVKNETVSLITNEEYNEIYDKNSKKFNDKFVDKLILKYDKKGYEVVLPVNSANEKCRWTWSYEGKFREAKEDIIIKRTRNGITLYKKQRPNLDELPTKKPKSILYKPEYSSGNGTNQFKELLGGEYFRAPKPIQLLKDFIVLGCSNNSLILDFFSGSATTAHAVMQLNAEDGGNRKFIMVQIPEDINPKKSKATKAAYDFCVDELKQEPVITTIGKERIKRAANKIKKENESKLEEKPLDLGFKLFKIKSIPEKYIERMKDENNELLVTKMLSKEELQALLITWKTYDGYPLTKELKTVQFGKYNSYVVDRILYLVNTDFNLENLLEFIKKLDSDGDFVINKIVIFGYHFNSDILLTIKDMVTTYRNKKSIELDVEVRY